MANATRQRAVDDYLSELRRLLRDLPARRRDEIVEGIEEHIDELLSELDSPPGEADVRNVLDRVGDPEEIAAEARADFGVAPPRPRWTDTAAVFLLPVGGVFIPVLGWIAGVAMLWDSAVWTTREKLLGTFVVPGGVALPLFLLFSATEADSGYSEGTRDPQTLSGAFVKGSVDRMGVADWLGVAALALMAIASFATALHLWRRLDEARSR